MSMTSVTRAGLQSAGFFDTALARRLALDPVGLIDVGARWGVSPLFAPAGPLFSAVAIEPDAEEAAAIENAAKQEDWAGFRCLAAALGADAGEVDLHLYSRANNSSIFPVSVAAKARYALGGFDLVKKLRVPVSPLDALVFASGQSARMGEVLKLDTQGAEVQILSGGARTLRERVACLVTEAQFFALYDDAPQFAAIDAVAREAGLTLIGFADFQNRSTKRLDKRSHWGRERVFQADAIYFRDPCVRQESPRVIDTTVLMAVVLGYFDLALEWVDAGAAGGVAMDGVAAAVERIARVEPAQIGSELSALLDVVNRRPDDAHAAVGKFVDARRDLTTFHDIAVTRD